MSSVRVAEGAPAGVSYGVDVSYQVCYEGGSTPRGHASLHILTQLQEHEQWVCWRGEDRGGKLTKLPVDPFFPRDGYASVDDPTSWSSLSRAKTIWREMEGIDGVGFVFTESDPYVGIDLDNCRNPETGDIDGWAVEVMDRLDSYAEVSPSGTGVKIIARGVLEGNVHGFRDDGRGIEVYAHSRYFTLTLEHIKWTPSHATQAQDGIGWLLDHFFAGGHEAEREDELSPWDAGNEFSVPPEEWVQDALSHIDPDVDYHQWIQVGMALHDQVGKERGFEMWDEWSRGGEKYGGEDDLRGRWKHFSGRDPARKSTLASLWWRAEQNGWSFSADLDHDAIDNRLGELEDPPKQEEDTDGVAAGGGEVEEAGESGSGDGIGDGSDHNLTVRGVAEAYRDDSPFQPGLIGPGVLGMGDLGLLFGPPKSMKSMIMLDWMIHMAQGKGWIGGIEAERPLGVAMVQFENKDDQMRKRIQLRDLSSDEIESLSGRFFYTDRHVPNFTDTEYIVDLVGALTSRLGSDTDVLIIDPLANSYTGDSENDNQQMSRFLRICKYIRNKINPNAALFLVHHSSKMRRDERQAEPFLSFRGAGALRGAYDCGVCVEPVEEGSGRVRLWWELRNGPGIDPVEAQFRDGRFVELGNMPERKAGRSQQDRWTREAGRQCKVICELIRKEAGRGNFLTKNGFASKWANQHSLGSRSTLTRRLEELMVKRIILLFDAGDYGFEPLHPASNGHLCVDEMYVGKDNTKVEPSLYLEADGSGIRQIRDETFVDPGEFFPIPE